MGFFGALNREFARILVTRPRPDREGARESYARHMETRGLHNKPRFLTWRSVHTLMLANPSSGRCATASTHSLTDYLDKHIEESQL